MLKRDDIIAILDEITYLDWTFYVGNDSGRLYLQVRFAAPDLTTGEPTIVHGRKWWLSGWMTKSEIVQTTLKAILSSVEHEARETFRYRGKAIFGPHFDVDALADFCRIGNLDMRTGRWVEA